MIGADHHPDQPHPLFDEVDRHAVQLQPIIAAAVTLEDETAALAQKQPGFVDGRAAQSVASIARAARSGSAAWVMGRPITRIEAPWSSARRGVIIRF